MKNEAHSKTRRPWSVTQSANWRDQTMRCAHQIIVTAVAIAASKRHHIRITKRRAVLRVENLIH